MSLLSTVGVIMLTFLIFGLLIAFMLWHTGQGSVALGWRCLVWDFKYITVSRRIRSLMRATGESGGENSPYFESLQEAYREEADLRRRHPASKSP